MYSADTLPFSAVWFVDFEFKEDNGERPVVHCMVARELRSGHTLRLWADELTALADAPFDLGPNTLYVAYAAQAELKCHLSLGWRLPALSVSPPAVEPTTP